MTAAPYETLTGHAPLLPGYRVTAYFYARNHGLPVTFGYLQELGLRAARAARWLGMPAAMVPEGPFWVHTWEPWLWEQVAALTPPPEADPAFAPWA